MRFWWVNQNQTFEQEFDGGYLWSPKRKSNDQRNPFYEFMREVAPGDVIFSFAGTLIPAIGIAQSTAYEAPKPPEFGVAGPNWANIGWKVAIRYFNLERRIRPSDHTSRLLSVLPPKYSPLQANGNGNQGVYLTHVSSDFAHVLVKLIGDEARNLIELNSVAEESYVPKSEDLPDIIEWEDHISEEIQGDESLDQTERQALVTGCRGQGVFKRNVQLVENRCRITGVGRLEHLIASHCKPWRDCSNNAERLDGENGLLLTPSIVHLFDRGYISFENNGQLLLSPVAHPESLRRMGVPLDSGANVGSFSTGQRTYLEFHRERVFLESAVSIAER